MVSISLFVLKVLNFKKNAFLRKSRALTLLLICEQGNLQSNAHLANDNMYTKFGLNKSIRSQNTEQNRILASIKGCNSVATLRKITVHNPKVDLINDVITKFGVS